MYLLLLWRPLLIGWHFCCIHFDIQFKFTGICSPWVKWCCSNVLVRKKWFLNPSTRRQNGRYFAYNIFKCIFMNEKFHIWIWIWLKFVLRGPIDNISALVQVKAWHQTGSKPLPEPMLILFINTNMRRLGEMCLTHRDRIYASVI